MSALPRPISDAGPAAGDPAGPPVRRARRPDDPAILFDEGAGRDLDGTGIRAELDSYRSAATLATVFALVGSAGVLIALGLVVQAVVLPAFHGVPTTVRAPAAPASFGSSHPWYLPVPRSSGSFWFARASSSSWMRHGPCGRSNATRPPGRNLSDGRARGS